jgi:hypothetical protein
MALAAHVLSSFPNPVLTVMTDVEKPAKLAFVESEFDALGIPTLASPLAPHSGRSVVSLLELLFPSAGDEADEIDIHQGRSSNRALP